MRLIAAYPYLVGSLAFLAMFGILYALNPAYRRVALLSAALSTPYSLLAVVFVPAYWEPAQVFRFLAGPEDLMFSFATGGVAWIIVAGSYYAVPDRPWGGTGLLRLAQATTGFLLLWLLLRLAGLSIMWAALAAGVGLWSFLVARDRGALTTSIKGGVVFSVAYTLVAAAVIYANPSFAQSWAADGLFGVTLLGLPLEEALWAFEFAAIWPLLVAYSLDMKPKRVIACESSRPGETTFGTTTSPA
jgi:hypothetical protein